MKIIFILLLICLAVTSYSQNADSLLQKGEKLQKELQQLPGKYFSKVDKKITNVNEQLTKKSIKYLQKLERQEKKLQEKLAKLNPESASNLVAGTKEKYEQFTNNLKSKTVKAGKLLGGQYSGYIDTLSTSLSFLKQFKDISSKVNGPMESLKDLQSKFQESQKIKEFIAQRKQQMKELLSKYTKVPPGLKKQYEKYSKQAYYYSAQIKEYKDMLKDPEKIEKKALSLLNKIPAFQNFMKQNSQLASLFRVPGDYGSAQNLTGLQTRASIQNLIQQQISIGGSNAQAQIQQNLAQARAEMDKLKDKINKLGGGSSDVEMPDFKPNSQKTKSFLKRFEYGCNVQFGKTNSLMPTTADIGLSLGYKLNDKSVIGIGASYKMGMGTIQHIQITHQGIGLRSFVDYKIKKQLFISGGYEMNYNAQFKNIEQLKNFGAWQTSGLIGLSKKYKVTKKVKGEMKLLYDFFAYDHIPVSQPIVFRLGYTFK